MANVASTIVINLQTAGAAAAQSAIQNVGSTAQFATGLVKGLALALVGLGVDGFMEATKNALEFGDSLAETSAKLGVTAEELQRLQAISIDLNSDVESLTSAFESSKEMIGLYELGSTKATKAIGLLGDEVKNAIRDGKSSQDVFLLQIKALSEYSDVNERAAVAQRAGLGAMIDLATAYADGKLTIDDLKKSMADATVISNENAAKASELNDKWDKLALNLSTEVKSAIITNSDTIFDLTKTVLEGTVAVLNFFAAWHEGNSLLGSIAIANGELTKKQVITQDLAEATEKLNKAQRDLDNQGPHSAARGVAEQARDKQLAQVNELKGRLDTLIKSEEALAKLQKDAQDRVTAAGNRANAHTKPVGATDLGGEDKKGKSKAETELERLQKAEERYAAHSELVFDNLAMAKMRAASEVVTDEVEKLRQVEAVELATADRQLKDAKLHGAELEKATQMTEELKFLIKQKYALKEKELIKQSQDAMKTLIDDGEDIIAKAENDKVRQVQLSTAAQIRAYTTRYDIEIARAKAAGLETIKLEQEKARVVEALERKKGEDLNRISGSYWEQLTQRMKDNYTSQGTMSDQFNKGLVDITTKSFDDIAAGMAEMAVSGKASWADMGMAIIKEIEKLIAKMLVMYAVEQMLHLFSGGMGSATQYSSTTGLGQWGPNYGMANGGGFDNGIQFFADGDVFDKPTMFQSTRGLGVMGEAGPEAIMPLSRGADGKLGVKSAGTSGGGLTVGTIVVNVKSNDKDSPTSQGTQIVKSMMEQMKKVARQEILDSVRPGNTLNPINSFGR